MSDLLGFSNSTSQIANALIGDSILDLGGFILYLSIHRVLQHGMFQEVEQVLIYYKKFNAETLYLVKHFFIKVILI